MYSQDFNIIWAHFRYKMIMKRRRRRAMIWNHHAGRHFLNT